MSKRQIGVALLSISLLFAVEGCKKKAPAPPPPPKAEVKPPPPPPPAKPVISSFTVEPSSIEEGQTASLRWAVTGANRVSIDNGIGSVQSSGTRSVSPSGTTTYRLSAEGDGGSAESTVTLRVNPRPVQPPAPTPVKVTKSLSDLLRDYGVEDALFDYDKSDVREDARAVLTRNADALKRAFAEAEGTIMIEGHCDERGSAEYNLALGDRRSTAARDFLVQLGVSADRLRVISYGKEKPQCTEANEGCWQKNRRAHFVSQ